MPDILITDLVKISASSANYTFNMNEGMRMELHMEDMDRLAACTCNANHNEENQLKDVRVAYVGGVESLMPCYKELAESFGCLFCYHGGHCEQGKKEIEGLVGKNDVIFCPVDINSHNACRLVKEACRLRNKPCYFLRSSSLSALKNKLENFAKGGYGQGE